MRLARLLLAVCVAVGTLLAMDRFAWRPFVCHRELRRLDAATIAAMDTADEYRRIRMLRRNVAAAAQCQRSLPLSADAKLILAANLELSFREEEAIAVYRELLRYHRRPEIYLKIGMAQLRVNGQDREGFANVLQAVRFDPPLVEQIADPVLRARMEEQLAAAPR